MWILQGNRLKDLSVPDLFTYIKNTNIDVKKFTTSEKMYHNTFNNYIKNYIKLFNIVYSLYKFKNFSFFNLKRDIKGKLIT